MTARMTDSPFSAEDAGGLRFDSRARLANAWPRYAVLVLSAWLFVSAFLFPTTRDACAAAWISATITGMTAFAAIWASPVRFFNVLLGGIALLWQAAAASNQPTAHLNGIIVCALIMAFALVPSRKPTRMVPRFG